MSVFEAQTAWCTSFDVPSIYEWSSIWIKQITFCSSTEHNYSLHWFNS